MNIEKNKRIMATRAATKLRRRSLVCKVFEAKLDLSHQSNFQKSFLHQLFLEAKWFYNDVISSDIFGYDTKKSEVVVLVDGKPELRDLEVLSGQIKQELIHRIKQSVFNLSKSKKRGRRVGRLRFKSYVSSIPLVQFRHTFDFSPDRKHIRIQGCRKYFKVSGLKQIPKDAEIANAVLKRIGRQYFLKVTTFCPKEVRAKTGKKVGIDFGIKTTLTTSDGEKIDIKVPETKRLKLLSRGINKKVKGSKNRRKQALRYQEEFRRITNRKKDLKNKIVRKLVNAYDVVVVQEESPESWKREGNGKGIQQSLVSELMSDLKRKSETFIEVDKWFPSSQLCSHCGNRQEMPLKLRTYSCHRCGRKEDRDLNAARNILSEGISGFMERKPFHESGKSLVEFEPLPETSCEEDRQVQMLKQEAVVL